MPSASISFICPKRRSSNSPPVVESQTMPTMWPAATCASARSRTCRKIPPTGERKQWTILSLSATRCLSEQAFADVDGISRQQGIGGDHTAGYHLAVDIAGDVDALLVGAWREAPGNGDGFLDRQAGHVGILAGGAHFAHDEDRPV